MRIDFPAIVRLDSRSGDFDTALRARLNRAMLGDPQINQLVSGILADVAARGDEALLEYAQRFDRVEADSIAQLTVGHEQMQISLERLPARQATALREAAARIRDYHERQKQLSWQYQDTEGSVYGQKISPLDRVGIYVPGGKANYPSSMLMNGIPAQVAGVGQIIATVPTRWSEQGDLIFAAAALAGVERVITVGGAQAIAALAYGTQSVPKVDKITGPGNIYVTIAKKHVFSRGGD